MKSTMWGRGGVIISCAVIVCASCDEAPDYVKIQTVEPESEQQLAPQEEPRLGASLLNEIAGPLPDLEINLEPPDYKVTHDDRIVVQAFIRAQRTALATCLEGHAHVNEVHINFHIQPDGTVQRIDISGSGELPAPAQELCLRAHIDSWKIKRLGDDPWPVSYNFEPGAKGEGGWIVPPYDAWCGNDRNQYTVTLDDAFKTHTSR